MLYKTRYVEEKKAPCPWSAEDVEELERILKNPKPVQYVWPVGWREEVGLNEVRRFFLEKVR